MKSIFDGNVVKHWQEIPYYNLIDKEWKLIDFDP